MANVRRPQSEEKYSTLECRLAVLGTCCSMLDHGESGVGKSSLCSRFIHPGVDTWLELGHDHSHWLSQTDFSEAEINGDHFVYFGAAKRLYLPRAKFSSHKVNLKINVVEHTTFLEDSMGQTFAGGDQYEKRAARPSLKSPGKHSYACRSFLGEDEAYTVIDMVPQPLPREYAGKDGVDGYLFVLDPSKSAEQRKLQWQIFTECWRHIPEKKKKACAIALTKCDTLPKRKYHLDRAFDVVRHFQGITSPTSEAALPASFLPPNRKQNVFLKPFSSCDKTFSSGKLSVINGKYAIPVFFTSADHTHGVDQPFLYLAHRSLNLPGRPVPPQPWHSIVKQTRDREKNSLLLASNYFKTHVQSHKSTWKELSGVAFLDPVMDNCRKIHGISACKSLFQSHALLLTAEAAKAQLERDIARDKELGMAAGPLATEPVMQATRLRSYTARMTQQHPDLKDLVKEDTRDGRKRLNYEYFILRTQEIHTTVRDIIQRQEVEPIAPTTEEEEEEEDGACDEAGGVVQPYSPGTGGEDSIYEVVDEWEKFDRRIAYMWASLSKPTENMKQHRDHGIGDNGGKLTIESPAAAFASAHVGNLTPPLPDQIALSCTVYAATGREVAIPDEEGTYIDTSTVRRSPKSGQPEGRGSGYAPGSRIAPCHKVDVLPHEPVRQIGCTSEQAVSQCCLAGSSNMATYAQQPGSQLPAGLLPSERRITTRSTDTVTSHVAHVDQSTITSESLDQTDAGEAVKSLPSPNMNPSSGTSQGNLLAQALPKDEYGFLKPSDMTTMAPMGAMEAEHEASRVQELPRDECGYVTLTNRAGMDTRRAAELNRLSPMRELPKDEWGYVRLNSMAAEGTSLAGFDTS